MALLFQQVSSHGGIYAAGESDDNTLEGHVPIIPNPGNRRLQAS